MARDKLTFYPTPKNRDIWEDYEDFRHDYLFTDIPQYELSVKYQLQYPNEARTVALIRRIKDELGVPHGTNRGAIQRRIIKGELKVDEWL